MLLLIPLLGRGPDDTKYPIMHRTGPTTKNYVAPNVNNTKRLRDRDLEERLAWGFVRRNCTQVKALVRVTAPAVL